MIRIYRCILAILMVLFIGFGVWYVTINLDEQRSNKRGTLVFEDISDVLTRGEKNYASDYCVY